MKESRIQEAELGTAPTTRRQIGKINATIKIAYGGELTRNVDKFVRELNKTLNESEIQLTHFSIDALTDKQGYRIKTQSGAEGDENCASCPEEMQGKKALRGVGRPPDMHHDNMKVGEVSAFNTAFSGHITEEELEQVAVEAAEETTAEPQKTATAEEGEQLG